jgi:hypothetical protein
LEGSQGDARVTQDGSSNPVELTASQSSSRLPSPQLPTTNQGAGTSRSASTSQRLPNVPTGTRRPPLRPPGPPGSRPSSSGQSSPGATSLYGAPVLRPLPGMNRDMAELRMNRGGRGFAGQQPSARLQRGTGGLRGVQGRGRSHSRPPQHHIGLPSFAPDPLLTWVRVLFKSTLTHSYSLIFMPTALPTLPTLGIAP